MSYVLYAMMYRIIRSITISDLKNLNSNILTQKSDLKYPNSNTLSQNIPDLPDLPEYKLKVISIAKTGTQTKIG